MRNLKYIIALIIILTFAGTGYTGDFIPKKASQIKVTPAGGIASTNVQDALVELDVESNDYITSATETDPIASAWTYSNIVGLWTTCTGYLKNDGTCVSLVTMTYPGAGVPVSTGSAWDTSLSTDGSGDCTSGAVCLGDHTHSSYAPLASPQLTGTPAILNGGSLVIKAAGDATSVTLGPTVGTTLGVTGTINATGLQVGGTGVRVKDANIKYVCTGQGCDYATLNAAITGIGATVATVVVSESVAITTASVPATMTVVRTGQGLLTFATGQVLTFLAGSRFVNEDNKQAFSCYTDEVCIVGYADTFGVFSPKWLGATGDGSTNDTIPLQTMLAIAAANGGMKMVNPSGTYIIAGADGSNVSILQVPSNSDFSGMGNSTVFKLPTNANNTALIGSVTSASNWRIHDIMVDGNRANQAAPPVTQGAISTGSGASNFGIYKIHVKGGANDGINITDASDGYISECTVEDSLRSSIKNINGNNVRIINNHLRDGITGIQDTGTSIESIIAGNDIADASSYGILFGDTNTNVSSKAIITGNNVHDNGAYGILVTNPTNQVDMGVIVSNNLSMDNVEYGIAVTRSIGVVLSNNFVSGNGAAGIYIIGGKKIVVDGNVVRNSVGYGISVGIASAINSSNIVISNNIAYDDQTLKTQTYGLGFTAGTTLVNLSNNNFADNLTGHVFGLTAAMINYTVSPKFHIYTTTLNGPALVQIENAGTAVGDAAQVGVKSDTYTATLMTTSAAYTYHEYPGFSLSSNAPKLSIMNTNASGIIQFLTAGDNTNNIRMYLNATGLAIGNSFITPVAKLDVRGLTNTPIIQFGSVSANTVGGIYRAFAEALSGSLSGASGSIAVNIPGNSRLIGVQLRVDTLITCDGTCTWSALYAGGSTTAIGGGGFNPAKNTKVSIMHTTYEITATTTTITVNCASNFTAGVIRAVVYYETLSTMGDAP